jgi:plastocyanin
MRKRLIGSICLGGLSVVGLLLWHQSARAAEDVKTIDIVLPGPVFAEPNLTITAGQSIKWVAKDVHLPHQLVEDGTGKEITRHFESPETPTHKFETVGIVKYHCKYHPATMVGTITVN